MPELEIVSIHFDLLKDYFRSRKVPEALLDSYAIDNLRTRALILCDYDKSQLDSQGLPKESRLVRQLEAESIEFLKNCDYKPPKPEPSTTIKIKRIAGQKDPEFDYSSDTFRGDLEETYDISDPIIGGAIKRFVNVANKHGLKTGELVKGKHAAPNAKARKEIIYTAIAIVKELLFLIGPEIYDKLGERVGTMYFSYFMSEDLMSHSSVELGDRIMTLQPKGYWAALPRLWVEEVFLLIKNPRIAEYIITLPLDSIPQDYSIRDFIRRKAEKIVIKGKNPIRRVSKAEYIVGKLLSTEKFDVEKMRRVARAFRKMYKGKDNLRPDHYGRFQYEERFKRSRDIRAKVENYFSQDEDPVVLRKSLIKICDDISNLDEAYATGVRQVTSKKGLEPSLLSARASLRHFNEWVYDFDPIIINTEEFMIRLEPTHGRKETDKAFFKLKVVNINDIKIEGEYFGEREILEYVKANKKLEKYLTQIKNSILKIYKSADNNAETLYDPENLQVNFIYYAILRYLFRIMYDTWPEYFETNIDENAGIEDESQNASTEEIIVETRTDLEEIGGAERIKE